MFIAKDVERDPHLARQLGELRGAMHAAAERTPLPERFDAIPHPLEPAMTLIDTETERYTVVPLFAYGAVRQALHDLFCKESAMTDMEIDAFCNRLKTALGRTWKSKLNRSWQIGDEVRRFGHEARWLRNNRGPGWLVNYRLPKEPPAR
jgi:hypothetical protein